MSTLLPAFLATLSALAALPSAPQGCTAPASAAELLPRARVALRLAGTEQVDTDLQTGCIVVAVRGTGTARLAGLVLRGMQVPAESVDIRVREQPAPALR